MLHIYFKNGQNSFNVLFQVYNSYTNSVLKLKIILQTTDNDTKTKLFTVF